VVDGTVIIAGGGTGGHIYPGVAIARAVEKLYPGVKVHFVGATGGLEEKIVPREGFPLHVVPVGKLHQSVGLFTRLKTVLKLPLAFFAAWKILRSLKPVAVLGVGGFASGPILFVASLFGYRTLIWEPNAYPGLANRLLARRVDESLLVFEEAGRHLHSRRTSMSGLPVRATMLPVPRTPSAPLRVLVFGGSQGARFINRLMPAALREGDRWMSGIELVHQTGPNDFASVKEAYAGSPFSVFEYLHDMDQRYAWADLVVCRSGASTVAEICACRKAAVFIPLPTAADDHQRKNAEVLAKADAAMICLQSELTPESFRATLKRFRDDRSLIARFEENVVKFQYPNAAEKIAERLVAGAAIDSAGSAGSAGL
jgi:UDP-N-acetylglucosamine--N-acetylmuramyl-(pentapeptide) pyrophosphoryl-undecaprenol N-acetylglucosamine transferase